MVALTKSTVTKARCEEWSKNPTINPITGKEIAIGKPTYNKFVELCVSYGIGPSEAGPSAAGPPKKVGEFVVPKTKQNWNTAKLTSRYIPNILTMLENPRLKIVRQADYDNFDNFAKLCEIGLEYNLVPEEEVEKVKTYISKYKLYKNNGIQGVLVIPEIDYNLSSNLLKYKERFIHDIIDSLQDLGSRIVMNGLDDRIPGNIKWYNIIRAIMIYEDLIEKEEITEAYIDEVLNQYCIRYIADFEREYIDITNMVQDHARANASRSSGRVVSASKSKTLPTSISIEKRKHKIPIRKPLIEITLSDGKTALRPDPNAPDEYREVSEEVEPPTNRSSFRPHDALSKNLTPFSLEHLEPLPDKTRVALLKELKEACNYMKDGISGKRFDRMTKKNLQLIVKIGNIKGKQRCYYVRNLYNFWKHNEKNNRILTDPETRVPITSSEKKDIMQKIKYINRKAKEPGTANGLK
jgi:hypothetical protein